MQAAQLEFKEKQAKNQFEFPLTRIDRTTERVCTASSSVTELPRADAVDFLFTHLGDKQVTSHRFQPPEQIKHHRGRSPQQEHSDPSGQAADPDPLHRTPGRVNALRLRAAVQVRPVGTAVVRDLFQVNSRREER